MKTKPDAPTNNLPHWHNHPDAWRCDENALYRGPCFSVALEQFQSLFQELSPLLTNPNTPADIAADARRQLERLLTRAAVQITLSKRAQAVWDLKQAEDRAKAAADHQLRLDEAHCAFAEEHATSGNTVVYASHLADIRERFGIDLLPEMTAPAQPQNTDQPSPTIVWDRLSQIHPRSPAYGNGARVRRYVDQFWLAGDQPQLIQDAINQVRKDPYMTPDLLTEVLEKYRSRREGSPENPNETLRQISAAIKTL